MAKLYIGDKFPNFTFNTAYKNNETFEKVIKNNRRTIFWVLRYIGCTTCRYDVHILSKRYQEFLDLDTQIYVVMQSDPAIVREDLKDVKLPFEIICDTGYEIYKELEINATPDKESLRPKDPAGIAKLEEKRKNIKESGFVHGKYEGNEQQLPALFVVENNGTVSYIHYAENIIDLPDVDEMLQILKKI